MATTNFSATHWNLSSCQSRRLRSGFLASSFKIVRKQARKEPRPVSHNVLKIVAADKQPWDLGRFVKTIFFFNEPSLQKLVAFVMEKVTRKNEQNTSGATINNNDLVLVVGATGGVGKRVVDVLKCKGISVRALVRNTEKAKTLLGIETDIVAGDITQRATLLPEYFIGVKKVINAASVIIGPKEGDTPDRQKYMQGIKFFEPEVKGDSPEAVEYIGMRNLIECVKDGVGVSQGKIVFGFGESSMPNGPAWGALDDVVMGGVSESFMQFGQDEDEPVGIFKGVVSTANNGGFASIRTKNFEPPLDLSAYDGLEIRIKGSGRRLKLIVRTSNAWDGIGYTTSLDTTKGEWQNIRLPFTSFVPVFRARTVKDAAALDVTTITSLQLMYSKFEYDGKLNPSFEAGSFEIYVSSIKAYLKEPVTPRFVHVSSAGVTRPDRPNIDLSKQPPAVRMNNELGYVLTYKLKGEDLLRESGIPYTIVRPCALTEEPAGAELLFEQGDNITGKISREEVARICVAALDSAAACDLTFEVKSLVPFSETFTIDPNNPPLQRDYEHFFAGLSKGITGKLTTAATATATATK